MDNPVAKFSSLNPLASSFVPSTGAEFQIEDTASESFQQVAKLSSSKMPEERTLVSNPVLTETSTLPVLNTLSQSESNVYTESKVKDVEHHNQETAVNNWPELKQPNATDPTTNTLLVAFFGLYRSEKARRPTMKIGDRPEKFFDKIWSVTDEDYKLWNPLTSSNKCNCPPMFGYHIPPSFFGNPFNLPECCNKQSIHLNHYSDMLNSSEVDVTGNIYCSYSSLTEDEDFYDYDELPMFQFDSNNDRADDSNKNFFDNSKLDLYTMHMKNIVSGVCALVSDFEDGAEQFLTPYDVENELEPHSSVHFSSDKINVNTLNEQYLEKPDLIHRSEVISEETKCYETLKNSNFTKTSSSGLTNSSEKKKILCNPPCSVWCGSSVTKKCDNSWPGNLTWFNSDIVYKGCNKKSLPSHSNEIKFPNFKDVKGSSSTLSCQTRSTGEDSGFSSNCSPNEDEAECDPIPKIFTGMVPDAIKTQVNSTFSNAAWAPYDGVNCLWQDLPNQRSMDHENQNLSNMHKRALNGPRRKNFKN